MLKRTHPVWTGCPPGNGDLWQLSRGQRPPATSALSLMNLLDFYLLIPWHRSSLSNWCFSLMGSSVCKELTPPGRITLDHCDYINKLKSEIIEFNKKVRWIRVSRRSPVKFRHVSRTRHSSYLRKRRHQEHIQKDRESCPRVWRLSVFYGNESRVLELIRFFSWLISTENTNFLSVCSQHDLTVKLHPINYSPSMSQLLRKQKYCTYDYIELHSVKRPRKNGSRGCFLSVLCPPQCP